MTNWSKQEPKRLAEDVTALWGAGTGLTHWLMRHWQDSNHYVIVDKDRSLTGDSVKGIPIFPPESLGHFNLRSIVVTVSDAAGVRELVRKMGLDERLLVFPPKSDLSSDVFVDEEMAKVALDWLFAFFRDAEAKALEPMLEFGTLLGIVRDGVPITWDNDLDVSFPDFSRDIVLSFCWMWAKQNSAYVVQGPDPATSISIHHSQLDLLIDASFRTVDSSQVSDSTAGPFGRISATLLYPRTRLDQYPALSGPSRAEEYLQGIYGPNWRIPDKEFSFVDYANLDSK